MLERLRFLSISASNLDEFYMVRVAGLRGQISAGISTVGDDGRTPSRQIKEINAMATTLLRQQQDSWQSLHHVLGAESIFVLDPEDLQSDEQLWLEDHFLELFRLLIWTSE